MDLSLKPTTWLRIKLEMEASPNFTENNELVVIEESIRRYRVHLLNEGHVLEG